MGLVLTANAIGDIVRHSGPESVNDQYGDSAWIGRDCDNGIGVAIFKNSIAAHNAGCKSYKKQGI